MSNLAANLSHLNATSSGTVISCAQLELEAGGLVSELCSVRFAFKSIGLTLNEFVALKVIAMTSIVATGAANAVVNGTGRAEPSQAQPDIPDPNSVLRIRDRYLKALVSYLSHKKPPLGSGSCTSAALALNCNGGSVTAANGGSGGGGGNTGHVLARMNSLLNCLAQVSSAANLLLQSKMFYVPFLMNSSSITAQSNGHYGAHHLPHHLSHHHHHNHMGLNHYDHHRNGNGVISVNGGGSSGPNSTSSSRSASSSPPSTTNGPTTNGLTNGTAPPTAILAGSGSNCS